MLISFDFSEIWRRKPALRERLAARPIAEKLRMLDAMSERAVSIRATRTARVATVHELPPNYGDKS